METQNRESKKRDRVIHAKDSLVVYIHEEQFVQRFDVTNAPLILSRANHAVETGAAPSGAGRVQTKGAVGMLDGSKVNIGAPAAWKRYLDAGILFSWQLDDGIEPRVDNVAGRLQTAQPARIDNPTR